MDKLLVNTPSGRQEVIEVGEGGGYFDAARVLWDERVDGPLPEINLGGMVRSGAALVFSQARMDEHTAASAPPVPKVVTMRQATQALILAGLDDDVETMLAAMPGVEGKLARAEWAKSQVVERDRPLVVQMGAALGLTPEQIDQLFITAASLP